MIRRRIFSRWTGPEIVTRPRASVKIHRQNSPAYHGPLRRRRHLLLPGFSMRSNYFRNLRQRGAITAAGLAMLAGGCAQAQPRAAPDPASRLDSAQVERIDTAIAAAIAERRLPGAVLHLERGGNIRERAYGRLSYEPGAAAVIRQTVFDAASLTKVLATAPAILLLAEDGKLDLDGKLVDYFPECAGGGKEAITIRHC
jgi:CubicO group peptidase (beta-lactamase class C family)